MLYKFLGPQERDAETEGEPGNLGMDDCLLTEVEGSLLFNDLAL